MSTNAPSAKREQDVRPAAFIRQASLLAKAIEALVCRRVWTRFDASAGIRKRKKKREDDSSSFTYLLVSYWSLAHRERGFGFYRSYQPAGG